MPILIYGFDEGKNKNEVYGKEEVIPAVHTEFDPLLNLKQDKHSTASATLLAASWSNKSQTVNVTGVTADNTVLVSADPASVEEYGACGVICTTQGAGTLTFTCKYTPTNDLDINIVILGV